MYEPRDWNDAERMVEHLESEEMKEHNLQPSGYAKRIELEYNKMFYLGILYGMALEAQKDRPLQSRGQL